MGAVLGQDIEHLNHVSMKSYNAYQVNKCGLGALVLIFEHCSKLLAMVVSTVIFCPQNVGAVVSLSLIHI